MTSGDNTKSFTEQGMPTYQQLVVPVLQAVEALGGSAKSREIIDYVVGEYPQAEFLMQFFHTELPSLVP